jgi:hypothetical protein
VADRTGESLGRLSDVIVRVSGADYPPVTGLVASLGGGTARSCCAKAVQIGRG